MLDAEFGFERLPDLVDPPGVLMGADGQGGGEPREAVLLGVLCGPAHPQPVADRAPAPALRLLFQPGDGGIELLRVVAVFYDGHAQRVSRRHETLQLLAAAVVHELEQVKELGFNLLRKHAKIEPQRWYYHCDRLGLIVWQDIVNGGSAYNLWFVTYLTNVLQPLLRRFPDGKACRRLLSRAKPASREEYAHELADTVQALRCHPCIACWVPFNEGWGQFDAGKAVQALRTLDGTRLVDEASGWFDQGGGDVHSLHNYFYPLRIRPQKRTVALSEYGGIAWPMPGHEPPHKTYGYGTAKDRKELTARYKKLQLKTVLPQLEKGLSALVYTQLTDVEDEVNGLFTYDRAAVKPDANAVRSVNAALAAEFARVTNPAKK